MSGLAVGLNLVFLNEASGGSGTYARRLIEAMLRLEPELRLVAFVARSAPQDLRDEPWAHEVEWVEFPFRSDGPPWHILAQLGAIPPLALRKKLDLIHGLAYITPPVHPGVAAVTTVLDVTWIHYPNTMSRRATLAMKALAPLCARRSDEVIAISEWARRDIANAIKLDEERVHVTPLGVGESELVTPLPEEETRRRFELGTGPVVLTVAQKLEHKNLGALVRAFARLELPEGRLVLPGSPTPHERELRDLAAALGVADRVRFPAWVSQEELEGLYSTASCFVLPSFMEGFGLPVLEAMRRGVPVACSRASSLPEVAGEAAAYFDPHSVDELAAAIGRVLADRGFADELVRRGHERRRLFTWERTARATLDVYRAALSARR